MNSDTNTNIFGRHNFSQEPHGVTSPRMTWSQQDHQHRSPDTSYDPTKYTSYGEAPQISPLASALRRLEFTRDARHSQLTQERGQYNGITPRTMPIKRLESTRDVRHGHVVIQRNEALTSMDPSKDPRRKVRDEGLYLNLTSRTNDTITVEWTYCPAQSWMPIDHFILEHSSVTNPDFVNVKLASNRRQYVLRNCTPGTNNFFVVSSVDVYGKVIIRSKQLTVQSSAPIDRPTLKLKKNLPNGITIEWNRPTEYGDGFISEYHLKVNGVFYTNIRSTKTSYDYVECRPMQHYTFRIQALSIKHDCNSEWSNVLDVACPAALPITLQRLRPKKMNMVKVGWNIPNCIGGAKVKEYKVYFKEASTYEMYNDQEVPDTDKIFGHRHAVVHTHKPDEKECAIQVDPHKKFWAILRAEITPEGCPAVITSPVRVRATMKPVAPHIKVTVYGNDERAEVDKEITIILDKQDKIKRRREILYSSDIVKGAELKNDVIQSMNVRLYQMEKRMQELVKVVNKLTGFVPVVIKWEKPEFDEFSEPTSYRINVDEHSYQDTLPLDDTKHTLKLDVEKLSHTLSVTTLSWHPVGHSDQSNVEVVQAKGFRPNRFFCYFTSHSKNVSWPSKGGCRLEDFLAHEKKLTHKNNVHRGLLRTRVTPKPFRVMGVHDATWQQLIRHFGARKPTIILFWTKWCISSQNMLEHFATYAHNLKDKYQYLACCVKSGEDILSHRKSIIELLNEKDLRSRGNIRHCCACHLAPDLPNNTVEKMENASIPSHFGLAGVPTFVILDVKGRVSWQGRVAADTSETFSICMNHVMSQVEEQTCPNMECQHCKDDEQGVVFEVKQEDENNNGHDENGVGNDENNAGKSESTDKFSLDEFHLLHSRLHGKALEEVEKTEEEHYVKLGSLTPRKEWLERRRANARKANDHDKSMVRFVEVSGEGPRHQNEGSRSPSTKRSPSGDVRSYPYRQPERNYRSPNNGYDKPRHGYGGKMSTSWREGKAQQTTGETQEPAKSSYRYSTINYHKSEKIWTGEPENEGGEESGDPEIHHTSQSMTSLGYQSPGMQPWKSAIKADNVKRDTSRGNGLSSTWPRTGFEPQEEEVYEFMVPTNMRSHSDLNGVSLRKTGTNGLYPDIARKDKGYGGVYLSNPELNKQHVTPKTYVYTRPSTRDSMAPSNDVPKTPKKKNKYSHIQSRYRSATYKPENPRSGVVISARKGNRSASSLKGRKTPGH